jgi:hypothetical protein
MSAYINVTRIRREQLTPLDAIDIYPDLVLIEKNKEAAFQLARDADLVRQQMAELIEINPKAEIKYREQCEQILTNINHNLVALIDMSDIEVEEFAQ